MKNSQEYLHNSYKSVNYNFLEYEKKWQKIWKTSKVFETNNNSTLPKYYILEMFPYPSGKIHMGHIRNYVIGDVISRFKKANGFNVLHPMGWDSFGLPAENAAREQNISPKEWTYKNIKSMKETLYKVGLSIDWSREIITSNPEYYKHEQKFFIDFYKMGLAYKKETVVNWDPVEETVLANEQVIDGKGWRSGAKVERKLLSQWFLKITDFAEELLQDLNKLTNWPSQVIAMQKNWIGKSSGVIINFKITNPNPIDQIDSINIFSTRPDTIYGATFIAISKNHPLAKRIANNNTSITSFIQELSKDELDNNKNNINTKKGVYTNLTVQHPLIPNKELPIFIANFVLENYGCGAILGVPAHDIRDFEFAQKYNLPIVTVVAPKDNLDFVVTTEPYLDYGILVNSETLNGLTTLEAKKKVTNLLKEKNIGTPHINYHLRDWGISRQRYWGSPIPIVYCDHCGIVPEDVNNLPVTLPTDINFNNVKGNPLDSHPTWKFTLCPNCKQKATRETDTFDTFIESSWYFLKFTNNTSSIPFTQDDIEKWLPVDHYIGGIEHAILHLLYSRFFVKALKKANYFTSLSEPFKSLTTQGMICHKTYKTLSNKWVFPEEVLRKTDDTLTHKVTNEPIIEGFSEKMSKSKKNIISPDYICSTYGADTARLFVLSDAPPTKDLEWSEEGIEGTWKFINKLWRFSLDVVNIPYTSLRDFTGLTESEVNLVKFTHKTLKEIEINMSSLLLNKVIANIRELFNFIISTNKISSGIAIKYSFCILVRVLNPFIPHITEEIWQMFGFSNMLALEPWPVYNKDFLVEDTITIAVQVSGKTRGNVNVPKNISQEELLEVIKNNSKIYKFFKNCTIKKVIYVKSKIINIVI